MQTTCYLDPTRTSTWFDNLRRPLVSNILNHLIAYVGPYRHPRVRSVRTPVTDIFKHESLILSITKIQWQTGANIFFVNRKPATLSRVGIVVHMLTDVFQDLSDYHSPTKLWEGNVFSHVCLFTCGHYPYIGPHYTWTPLPLPQDIGPYCTVTSGTHHWWHVQTCSLQDPTIWWLLKHVWSMQADGTRPTGILSSFTIFCWNNRLLVLKIYLRIELVVIK